MAVMPKITVSLRHFAREYAELQALREYFDAQREVEDAILALLREGRPNAEQRVQIAQLRRENAKAAVEAAQRSTMESETVEARLQAEFGAGASKILGASLHSVVAGTAANAEEEQG